jgi:hypothetical protein
MPKRKAIWIHGALFAALVACGACGGAAGRGQPSQVPPSPSAAEAPAPPGSTSSTAAPEGTVPGAGSASAPSGLPPVAVEMKAPIPTAMADDLRALGLDARNLPPIEKLEPRTLRGVMKLMARSLGVKCGDCHQEGDFAAPTRRKKIAAHMWDDFAAKMTLDGGGAPVVGGMTAGGVTGAGALFCDSCHQGRVQLLDRRDKKALSKWMDDSFVAKLEQKDGKSTECETCHVDMDMHFLAKWGQ